MSDAWWWLIVAGIFLLIEVTHRAFYAAFLVIGALVAALVALASAPLAAQVPAFAAASVGGLLMARPSLTRAMARGHHRFVSGAQGLVGREAVVTETVADLRAPGKIAIQGEQWRALSSDGSPIEVGAVVLILELDSSTFVVQKLPELGAGFPELSTE
ncbi:MAG: NfeD family protein [Acidimicrobiales bacterium]